MSLAAQHAGARVTFYKANSFRRFRPFFWLWPIGGRTCNTKSPKERARANELRGGEGRRKMGDGGGKLSLARSLVHSFGLSVYINNHRSDGIKICVGYPQFFLL